MMVGTKAIATLSTGYLNALEYAKTRVQGADLTQMADKAAPRVTITHHPDVRRSLMLQKAYAEGLRALVLYTATQPGRRPARRARGSQRDEVSRRGSTICCCRSSRAAARSGPGCCWAPSACRPSAARGFLQDYPIEQYVRDAKIDTLYEGTTAIQGMDFFFRKIVRDKGQALGHARRADRRVRQGRGRRRRASPRSASCWPRRWRTSQGIVGAMVAALMASRPDGRGRRPAQRLQGRPEHHPAAAGRRRPGDRLAAAARRPRWLWPRSATVARLPAPPRRAFYEGKVAAARFFARTVLPRLTAERAIAEATDNDADGRWTKPPSDDPARRRGRVAASVQVDRRHGDPVAGQRPRDQVDPPAAVDDLGPVGLEGGHHREGGRQGS